MRKYNKRVYVGTAEWWQKWTRYEPETGCVVFTGFANSQGYCLVHRPGGGRNDNMLVHRLAYEQVYGSISPGLVICHRCDVPNCVNPPHLFLGTQKDNLRDMFAKGRARPRGKETAPLTVFPAVSYRVVRRERQSVASLNKRSGVNVLDVLPLIGPSVETTRSSEIVPRWCEVIGVPERRPTTAIVLYKRPQLKTGTER
jgi:hypothetical protein